jgi:hypothetical protein
MTDRHNQVLRIGQMKGTHIAILTIALCLPFTLVEIPPLVDVPGHIAVGAIEAAPVESPLQSYFAFDWQFTLNMGGELLMKALTYIMTSIAAGWWVSVIATASLILGVLTLARTLNPRGAYGVGWALMFVFSFPWVWGFINFILAAGLALLSASAVFALDHRPKWRAFLLVLAQPLVLICHAIGGLLLPVIVAAVAIGETLEIGGRWRKGWQSIWSKCWPLISSAITVAAWKLSSLGVDSGGLQWDWRSKRYMFLSVLRDQSIALDLTCVLAAYSVIVGGTVFGARWTWRQALPCLAFAGFFLLLPSKLSGSEAVDVRLLPIAIMMSLALQDWGRVDTLLSKLVWFSGFALLLIRLAVMANGFVGYADDYRRELSALAYVKYGSRVFTIHEQICNRSSWRLSRLDTLPMLASASRSAWMNNGWTVPGIHMLRLKYAVQRGTDLVWDPVCKHTEGLEGAIRRVPVNNIDYLWLVGTGVPEATPPHLRLVWRSSSSALFKVSQ